MPLGWHSWQGGVSQLPCVIREARSLGWFCLPCCLRMGRDGGRGSVSPYPLVTELKTHEGTHDILACVTTCTQEADWLRGLSGPWLNQKQDDINYFFTKLLSYMEVFSDRQRLVVKKLGKEFFELIIPSLPCPIWRKKLMSTVWLNKSIGGDSFASKIYWYD